MIKLIEDSSQHFKLDTLKLAGMVESFSDFNVLSQNKQKKKTKDWPNS